MKNEKALVTALMGQIEELTALLGASGQQKGKTTNGFLHFNEKEICKMPKTFKKEFRVYGCTARVRKRTDGRYVCSYEIRYRRNGYNISISATTLDVAKVRFVELLNRLEKEGTKTVKAKESVPTEFDKFSLYFYEKFRFRKVAEETKKKTMQMYNLYLYPAFGSMPIKSITPEACQRLIDEVFSKQNKKRTAVECKTVLNQTFKMAMRYGIIAHNPCDVLFMETYEKDHGKALTKDEETYLLKVTAGTPYQLMFAVALYCGLRPGEIQTAKLHGRFIKAVNEKAKDGKVHYKYIPITPMLAPYLVGVTELHNYCLSAMRDKFNSIFGDSHILKDLRKTFNTRCEECGVAEVAREKFMGHSLKGLGETYTELSDDFLYAEGQKVRY